MPSCTRAKLLLKRVIICCEGHAQREPTPAAEVEKAITALKNKKAAWAATSCSVRARLLRTCGAIALKVSSWLLRPSCTGRRPAWHGSVAVCTGV